MAQADSVHSTPRRTASKRRLQITSVEKPLPSCMLWSGTASEGNKKYEWFYEPRRWLHMRKQEPLMPRCWMDVEPPDGARRLVVKVIRAAKAARS
ncbi:MAG: hypothetical protein QOF56_914 [Acidobacteriaceae bacterium]|jgi:hypothetical protein|nr:hypothetical protein [Acidobacteriaceae bacterium]